MGGAEQLLVSIARASNRAFGCEFLYLMAGADTLVPALRAAGCRVHGIGARSNGTLPAYLPRLVAFLKETRPDVVHAHLPVAGAIGRAACAHLALPLVYTEHSVFDAYRPLTRIASRMTWNWQARVIGVSEGVSTSLKRNFPGGPPIETIYNGVDTARFSFDDEGQASSGGRFGAPFVVGTSAMMRSEKRLDRWVRVASAIHKRSRDVRFLVVGDGPERYRVESLATSLGLGEAISFVGAQQDVRPFLAKMSLYMLSSDVEGLPIGMLEAMAMGIPAVAPDVGGVSEVLEQGVSGWICPAGDEESLGETCLDALDSDLKSVGEAAARAVAARFSVDQMVYHYENVYRNVLAGGLHTGPSS